MKLLQLTLGDPTKDIALDEALVDAADAGELAADEVLRIWEPQRPIIVLGRSSRVHEEVNVVVAQKSSVPIIRRASGGASVVIGPGCLMYALVLDCRRRPLLRDVTLAHAYVLRHIAEAVAHQLPDISIDGVSDLVWKSRKFSGNSIRSKRNYLLYHGTLLYAMDLSWVTTLLLVPPRQPPYRKGRTHEEFLTNIPLDMGKLHDDLHRVWKIDGVLEQWPHRRTEILVSRYYDRPEWTYRF